MLFRRDLVFAAALVLVLALVTVLGAIATPYYVKTDGDNNSNGLTWTNAWQTIKHALDVASSDDVIHLRAGTYSPSTTGEPFPIEIGSSCNGITLLGAGIGMTILNAEGSDGTGTRRRVMNVQGHLYEDNEVPVDGVTIEGFTITGGYITGSDSSDFAGANGGGIYCYLATNLQIKDCEITDNYANGSFASQDGEGHYDWYGQTGTDGSHESARAGGGGIYLRQCKNGNSPTVTIDNCLIHDNETGMGGGGICSNYGPAIIRHCCIHSNKACQGGGVYWFDYVDDGAKIEHILFNDLIVLNEIRTPAYYGKYEEDEGDGDWTADQGGGVYLSSWGWHQKFRLYNVTVADNDGYEVYISHNCKNIDIEGANNIFWPDDDQEKGFQGFYDDGFAGSANLIYSDIWWDGDDEYPGKDYPNSHNIREDPKFEPYGDGTVITQCYFLERDSEAVDSGNKNATSYTPDIYYENPFTTDKAGIRDGKDGEELDMGFHYGFHSVSYIELVSFTATALPARIVLQWETGAEIDNAGFLLYRSEAGSKSYRCISGLIASQGSASSGASYAFVDEDVSGAVYNYYLVDIDTSGNWTAHGPRASAPISVPARVRLRSARTPGELASDEVVRVNSAHRQSTVR